MYNNNNNNNNNNNLDIFNKNISNTNNYPLLFNKKMKKLTVKPLKYIYNDMGKTRHFTPAAQEWFNSIYSFNPNYTKTLPTADNNLMYILKSYFNLSLKLNRFYKIKQLATRYKRVSAKKIFVGRGDLKHTNDNVIITFFVYNTEKMYLLSKIRKIFKILYKPKVNLKKFLSLDRNGKTVIKYNRPFSLQEYLALTNHYEEWYFSYLLQFVNKLNTQYSKTISLYETLKNLREKGLLNNDEKLILFNMFNINTFVYPSYKIYLNKCVIKYTKVYYRLMYWLWFNNLKFSTSFIEKLTSLVMNMYDKKVEFNIISLKKMHFNSDIFTQGVTLKLRNRKNKLYRVLKASLRKLKLPYVRKPNRLVKGDKNEYFVNKIRNNNISSMFTEYNKDSLSKLLFKSIPWKKNLKVKVAKHLKTIENNINLENYVFHNLKHREMAGVRVEAKGRLTKRFTASRSIFKMKWKGGLKNVDSSFRGLPAIILRGHVKSNIQYSVVNTSNRVGAFGIKGWVSNK